MINPQRFIALAAALWAASAFSVAHAQTTTNTITTNVISRTTFDNAAPSAWGYGYFYGDNGAGVQTYNKQYFLPDDTDQTNAMWQYTFDLTGLTGLTGYGTGTGGPLFLADTTPGQFSSTNREDYVFSFDARAEGLNAGQSGNAQMQLQFYYPDENNQAVKTLQVNYNFTVCKTSPEFRNGLKMARSRETFRSANRPAPDYLTPLRALQFRLWEAPLAS